MLALAWSCTVAEAKQKCTIEEFHQWRAYYRISPFGEFRDDVRAAIVACTVAECAGVKKAKVEQFMADRFCGLSEDRRKKRGIEQMRATFEAYAKMHNAVNAKKRKR